MEILNEFTVYKRRVRTGRREGRVYLTFQFFFISISKLQDLPLSLVILKGTDTKQKRDDDRQTGLRLMLISMLVPPRDKEPSSHLPSKRNTTSNELCLVCTFIPLLRCLAKWHAELFPTM